MDVAFSLLVRMDLVDAELLRNILGMDSEDFFRERNCGRMMNDGLSAISFGLFRGTSIETTALERRFNDDSVELSGD